MDYLADVGITTLIYVILGVSLNLLLGFAGEVSLAHAIFYGIGGYTAGLLTLPVLEGGATAARGVTSGQGWPLFPALLVAIVVAFVFAFAISLPAVLRVSGEYLILLTLAFQSVVNQLMSSLTELTGGPYGLTPIPPPTLFGTPLVEPPKFFLLLLAVTVVVVLVCWGLGESPFGRRLKGIREDELVVRALGKATAVPKMTVFGISAAIAGMAGGLAASYYQFIAPGNYNLDLSIFVVAIVVLGGAGNFTGTVIGAVLLGALDPILSELVGDDAIPWQGVIYGLALVTIMRYRPEGIVPEGKGIGPLVRRLRGAAIRPAAAPAFAGKAEAIAKHGSLSLQSAPSSPPASLRAGEQGKGGDGGVGVGAAREERGARSEPSESAAVEVTDIHDRDVGPTAADGDPEHAVPARSHGRDGEKAIVQTEGLVKRFGGITAVDGVDLVLREGHITALIGGNGAGKTTVFNLITGIIRPDGGRVALRGIDITGQQPHRIAQQGMVRSFQDTRVFRRMSALDNVAVAVPGQAGENPANLLARPLRSRKAERQTLKKATSALSFVNLEDRRHELVANLSFGDQKLVAIARLLATEAEVLLLDEPTSGVDPSAVENVIDVILRMQEIGRTVCLVEHSVHFVERLADRAFFMDQGRVIASGTMAELRSQERLTEIYFGT
jgi:ABC-type branched-subunit amino acid transport system ATPase component/ABC-type branched-subunit amino acid transport system permease subunit